VYLKNRIVKGWSPTEDHTEATAIPENEKPVFRNRVIPILAHSTGPVRAQLIPTLQRVLNHDFPTKWPEYLDITLQLLQTNDAASVFSGIMCLLALCRVYRYKANEVRGDFDKVVSVSFPLLLGIGNNLINEDSIEAGEMLRMILKAYKLAIYVRLTARLHSR
jgi:importin-7